VNVANTRGDVLVCMIKGPEDVLVRSGLHHPMTHALVAARHREQYLFIFIASAATGKYQVADRTW